MHPKLKKHIQQFAAILSLLPSLFLYVSIIGYLAAYMTGCSPIGGIGGLFLTTIFPTPIAYFVYNHLVVRRFIPKRYVVALDLMLPLSYLLFELSLDATRLFAPLLGLPLPWRLTC